MIIFHLDRYLVTQAAVVFQSFRGNNVIVPLFIIAKKKQRLLYLI